MTKEPVTLVTLEIEGVVEPVALPLSEALARLWDELKRLPLGANQLEAYRHFLRAGAEERVRAAFLEDGLLQLSFALDGEIRLVRATPARVPAATG
ncbi:hypothetical protein OG689_11135 [Kitasatospora sp. NBC_00240]|uniref:hypothetical protein n=1 Tax=Kitasatospora sp. NBC_00240 TaxID=2903567 RepID=UPI00224D3B4D|nr:hypothetical protein [Kitasatospora sp. NBC_00240]MCX5209839.1 hypothetical protein [Kitasatospora sp. NBC_00240]